MSGLEFAVAQAAFRARQIERALHDSGPWEISWGAFTVPACRLIGEREIKFLAHFPAREAVPVKLTQDVWAFVSPEDVTTINRHSWSVGRRGGSIYAQANIGGKPTLMHTLLLPDAEMVDHINGDTLDNRRSNLRAASKSQNGANRGRPVNNTSGYKGVSWHKASQKWKAQITVDGKTIYLGVYTNPEAAAAAYDEAADQYFGAFAHKNLVEPEAPASLLCRGEIVGTQAIEFPGDGGFEFEWILALGAPVPA